MPVPKRKRSRQRRDKRFANKGIKVKSFSTCSQCSAPFSGHQACGECGFYKGRKVMPTKADKRLKQAESRKKSVEKSSEPSDQE
jgi:large subunit ribosomal protein L32